LQHQVFLSFSSKTNTYNIEGKIPFKILSCKAHLSTHILQSPEKKLETAANPRKVYTSFHDRFNPKTPQCKQFKILPNSSASSEEEDILLEEFRCTLQESLTLRNCKLQLVIPTNIF
jgi:hypothetical protein